MDRLLLLSDEDKESVLAPISEEQLDIDIWEGPGLECTSPHLSNKTKSQTANTTAKTANINNFVKYLLFRNFSPTMKRDGGNWICFLHCDAMVIYRKKENVLMTELKTDTRIKIHNVRGKCE